MKKESLLALAASSCIFASGLVSTAIAQDESPGLDDLQVDLYITANRIPTPLDQTASSVSVITREEIERSNQSSVAELIRETAGLDIVRTGAPGGVTSAFIRGAESDHTLVLIDGVRVNSNATGGFDLSNLNSANVESIEIIRGPQSVLYGSEAIGGVISITTSSGSGEGVSGKVSLSGGSFGTQNYSTQVGVVEGDVSASLSASYSNSDGFSTASEANGNTENDSYENLALNGKVSASLFEKGEAELSVRYVNGQAELDGFDFTIGPIDDPNSEQDNDQLAGSLAFAYPINENFKAGVKLGASRDNLEGTDPDTEFSNFDIESQTESVTTTLEVIPEWIGVLVMGHTFEKRKTDDNGNVDTSRDINSFFIQEKFAIDSWPVITAGVRYDDDSDFGDETTFRTSLLYDCEECGIIFRGSFGTGFKAPSANELFFPGFGNPDLEAETSWGYDLGIEVPFGARNAVFTLTWFQSEIDDLITSDPETFLASNIDQANILGIESALRFDLSERVSASIHYTWTDAENDTTGDQLARRPRHRGRIALNARPVPKLDVGLSLLIVQDRIDSDLSEMDDYERVDLRASYQVTEQIRPFLRIDNLLDDDYEELNGFETTDIAAYAGSEFRW